MTGAGRTRSQNESRQRGLSQAEASGRENEPTRKERDIRGHINAFVGRKFLDVVVPVSMATGLALGACNTSAVQPGSGAGGTVIQGTGGYIADRKSTRLNSSHLVISYAVFCLKQNN